MSPFVLQMWREWRAHRTALVALALTLPIAAGLAALALPASTVHDPLFAPAVSLAFALVSLVVLGGELLGSERRGRGLHWLERLPDGLAGAFRAKLAFFGLTLPLALLLGTGVAQALARVRAAAPSLPPLAPEGRLACTLAALVLGAWTFAASAWTLRGGLAVLAAAVVLTLVGLPVQHVLQAGYRPTSVEMLVLTAVPAAAALLSAWLAFVHGTRRSRGPALSAAFGLVPTLPILFASLGWASVRMAERDDVDPLDAGFRMLQTHVTADGRGAFVIGQPDLPRWQGDLLPMHALRLDLERGGWESLGLFQRERLRYRELPDGGFLADEIVFELEGRDARAFDAASGAARPWDPEKPHDDRWYPCGLGVRLERPVPRIRDPFRGRDFRPADLGESWYSGTLLVRPGRWLYSPSALVWLWLDPETNRRERVDWPEHARPLVVLEDGGILVADPELGLRMLHPEQNSATTLDTHGVAPMSLLPNPQGRRVPDPGRGTAVPPGTIVLTGSLDWLVVDQSTLSTRRLAIDGNTTRFVRLLDEAQAVVHGRGEGMHLARLDLETGAMTPLWPPRPTK